MKNKQKIAAYLLAASCFLTACKNAKIANKNEDEMFFTEDTIASEEIIKEDNTPKEDYNVSITPKVYYLDDENGNIKAVNDKVIEYYTFGYINNPSEILDIKGNVINNIDKYQKVLMMYDYNNYKYVQFEDQSYGFVEKDNITEIPNAFVEVDISSQTLNFYINNECVLTTPVITGKKDVHDTRLGYYYIDFKKTDTYLKGDNYNVHVNYWMPFDGGIGLHDAAWRYGNFGGNIYTYDGSHGCVNMPDDAAKMIYENVDAGTKVLVHK